MSPLSQSHKEQSARAIAELIEQLSRSLNSRSFGRQMNPAQWTALRYLAHANESARQVGAFAVFHNTTPSSASQTITALVKKGMVVKTQSTDGRSRTLGLTKKGHRTLSHDPILELSAVIQSLPDAKLYLLAETMQLLVQEVLSKR